jgi:hypothetical protein
MSAHGKYSLVLIGELLLAPIIMLPPNHGVTKYVFLTTSMKNVVLKVAMPSKVPKLFKKNWPPWFFPGECRTDRSD